MATPNADTFLQRAHGFQECRILLTAAELDLFTLLAPAPLGVEEIAARLNARGRGLTILLDALAGIGLLSKRDGRYHCEPEVAAYLASDTPDTVLPLVRHSASQWRRWSELTDIVRGTVQPGTAMRTPEDLRAFIEAMDVVSRPLASSVVAAVNPGSAKSLLDVGGGPGSYTAAFLNAAPEMNATLFDQPDVIEIARQRLDAAGLLERVTLVAGDFYREELPAGHDLALMSAIIHQNSLEQNLALYGKVFRALLPGGRVIIRDHVMQPERTRPRRGAVFAVNMLVSTAGGDCYTFDEVRDGLTQAGFERIRLIKPGENMDALVEAFKPQT
jgi:predicted O-methyltransferase YrrM